MSVHVVRQSFSTRNIFRVFAWAAFTAHDSWTKFYKESKSVFFLSPKAQNWKHFSLTRNVLELTAAGIFKNSSKTFLFCKKNGELMGEGEERVP